MEQEDRNHNRGEKDYSDLSDSNQNSLNNDASQWGDAGSIRGNDGYDPTSLNNAENKSAKQSNNLNEGDLSKTEDGAANNSSWDDNTGQGGGTHASRAKDKQGGGFKGYAKGVKARFLGRGPMIALAGTLGVGALIVAVVSSMLISLLPIHVAETFKQGFANMRNPMMTVGVQKTVGSKLTSNYSSGICKSSLSVKCKFKTASDKTIQKLTDNGVKVNTDGKSAFRGRNVVTSFEIDGKTISSPQEMSRALNTDASVRSKMDLSFKTRLMNFADAKFNALLSKLGINKNPFRDLADITNSKFDSFRAGVTDQLNVNFDRFKGTQLGSAVSGFADSPIVKKARKAMNGVDTPIELYCGANAFASAISTGIKAVRGVALVNFAMGFLSLADKMKAGEATVDEVQYLGESLSSTSSLMAYSSDSNAGSYEYITEGDGDDEVVVSETDANITSEAIQDTARSATDSQLFSWYAYNDSSPNLDSSASEFVIGAGASAFLAKFLSSASRFIGGDVLAIRKICRVVNSIGYDIVDTARKFFTRLSGVGLVLDIAMAVGIGVAASAIIKTGLGYLEEKVIPDDIAGQDYGNALSAGAGQMMSQNAQAGGGSLLTVDSAIAYHQETQKVLAMQAEEDRINLSPFDPTSKNTFLGSIVFASLPLATSGGVLSTLGTIGNIASRSFSSILPGASAVDNAKFRAGLDTCVDDFYEEYGIAAGPDCVPMRGVEVETLNSDPDEIFDYLISKDQINADLSNDNATLEDAIIPGGDLAKYKEYCSEREVPIGAESNDGGILGLGGPKEGWNMGIYCLYNPNGDPEQQNANYYSAFMNLVAAEESMDSEPDEGLASSSGDVAITGVAGDGKAFVDEYYTRMYSPGNQRASIQADTGYSFSSLVEQCYALSVYYAYQITGGRAKNPGGNGKDFVNNIVSQDGWKKVDKPVPGSIFSVPGGVGGASNGPYGHTGIIWSVDEDDVVILDNNFPHDDYHRDIAGGWGIGLRTIKLSSISSQWDFAVYNGGPTSTTGGDGASGGGGGGPR